MELELRRLEDLAESIVNDFAYMRAREEEMRDTNGKIAPLSLFCILMHCFLFRIYKHTGSVFQCTVNGVSSSLGCLANILSP